MEEIIRGPEPYPATVIDVEPLEDYKIRVKLSNGKYGIFDVTPYLESDFFRELKNTRYFFKVYVDYGTVVWPHEQDIAPETIELEMIPDQIATGRSTNRR